MEEKSTLIKYLIQIAESFAKTNIDLLKLKAISNTANVLSTVLFKLVFYIAVLVAIMLFNIAVALWLGDLVGKLYLGFLIVTAFYILVALVLNYFPNLIKSPVKDSFIVEMLNIDKDEKDIS